MKTQISTAIKRALTASAFVAVAISAVPASAGCGGGRRGGNTIGGGFGRSHAPIHSVYRGTPSRSPVVYRAAPVYHAATPYQPAPVYQNPAYQNPVQIQAQRQPPAPQTAPVPTAPTSQQASLTRPPSAPQATSKPAAEASSPAAATEANALAMLASLSEPASNGNGNTPTPANQMIPSFTPATPTHVGTWVVTLPGNQSVSLVLDNQQAFRWTVRKGSQTNSFSGTYRVETDRLVLTRSDDQQTMAGSWTKTANGYTFKVDGALVGGLEFRSGR